MATIALIIATAALAVALAAQAAGYYQGFSETTFRAVQIGAQLIAPLALTWALAELTGKSLGSRFAARLGLAALAVVGTVVLATDPLNNTDFTKSWPPASVHYQLIPNWVLEAVAIITAFFAVVAVIVAGIRGRQSARWRTLFLPVAAIAAASVATDWLRATLPANTGYPLICLAAAALAWFGGIRASKVRLESLRSGGYSWDEDTGSFVQYHDDSGDLAAYNDDTGGFGRDRGVTDGRGWYADDNGGIRRDPADTDFSGWFRPGSDTGSPQHGTGTGSPQHGTGTGSLQHDTGGGGFGGNAAGSDAFHPDQADSDVYRRDQPGSDVFRRDQADSDVFRRDQAEGNVLRQDQADTSGAVREAPEANYSRYGLVPPPAPEQATPGQNGTTAHSSVAYVETGDYIPVLDQDGYPAVPQLAPEEDTSRLYGQIAIYTLLDESAEDFERLAAEVVEQVKTREPDTLIYVMHGVPAAPMQRILYAVYRDEAAFDEHERQPYIRQFEEEREPFVLATNVIELGVKHGKLAPVGAKRTSRARKARPRSNTSRLPYER